MKKEVFIKLLRLANQEMFLYKDKLYQQHDVVSIGSPLAPNLANFLPAHIENKLLGKQPTFIQNCIQDTLMTYLLYLIIQITVLNFSICLILIIIILNL